MKELLDKRNVYVLNSINDAIDVNKLKFVQQNVFNGLQKRSRILY